MSQNTLSKYLYLKTVGKFCWSDLCENFPLLNLPKFHNLPLLALHRIEQFFYFSQVSCYNSKKVAFLTLMEKELLYLNLCSLASVQPYHLRVDLYCFSFEKIRNQAVATYLFYPAPSHASFDHTSMALSNEGYHLVT
jgi:hypothetical protein